MSRLAASANHVLRFVAHGRRVQQLAAQQGWLPGARYTNLRDVRDSNFADRGFLDIDWKNYSFERHLIAARIARPLITVARDILRIEEIDKVLKEAEQLQQFSCYVVIVPKDPRFRGRLGHLVPRHYLLGYSVPTRYGGTVIPASEFDRPVHLLGGRPDVQRALADKVPVFSFDCNRFTLDAAYGDYFDGQIFRPHPTGGYEVCITQSLRNINRLWHTVPRAAAHLDKGNLNGRKARIPD